MKLKEEIVWKKRDQERKKLRSWSTRKEGEESVMRRTGIRNQRGPEAKRQTTYVGGREKEERTRVNLNTKPPLWFFFLSIFKNKAERLEVPKGTETHVELPMFTMIQNWVQEWCRPTIHGQVIWASPGRWLEMQNLRYQPRPTDSEWTS